MARATKVIHKMEIDSEAQHERELRELEQLLTKHKELLGDILSIADKMKDRELLDMMNSSLGQGPPSMILKRPSPSRIRFLCSSCSGL